MSKTHSAKLLLEEINCLRECPDQHLSINMLTLVNQIIRNAQELAQEIVREDTVEVESA